LEDNVQKLQELDQLKSKFFANVSHELRTPLTLILAPTEMMLNRNLGDLTESQEKYLGIMHANSVRLLKLINSLLDLAKIDAGKTELYYHRTDFVKFVRGVVTSVSPMAEKKSLLLKFESHDDIPDFFFDPDKIEKVLLNLIFNALKFTEKGRIEVGCSAEENHVLVKVSDTGIGIPKEHISKLFTRFSQIDGSSSRKYEGTGIGLALAKELVELHRGKIWVESDPGRGTTFFFTIPIYTRLEDVPGMLDRRTEEVPVETNRREEDWTKSLAAQADRSEAGVVQKAVDLREEPLREGCHRILLVDDNADMLSYIADQLRGDYNLLYARDGQEGVDRIKQDLPDLVISDVMMPYKDGYQLCREVKQDPRSCHIPVILLTAKTDLSTKIEGLEQGADDYLTKPFNARELKARVRSLLSLRKLEREIQLRSRELEQTLAELKETQGQLVQSEKMAALGLLVAGMAHEVNNPLNFINASLSNLHRALDRRDRLILEGKMLEGPEIRESNDRINNAISTVRRGLERIEGIVAELLSYARQDEAQFRQIDLHEGLDATLKLLRPMWEGRMEIVREFGTIGRVDAIPGQINQVFLNLLKNAIEAIPEGRHGEIRIRTGREGEQVWIRIKDNGGGIPPEHLGRIFEPFFTTKEIGKGTGLGLWASDRIIQTHGGEIRVESRPGEGAEVTLTLPVQQKIPARK
jgi:signal transduction histidine kinase